MQQITNYGRGPALDNSIISNLYLGDGDDKAGSVVNCDYTSNTFYENQRAFNYIKVRGLLFLVLVKVSFEINDDIAVLLR